jgi:hypothetical protein
MEVIKMARLTVVCIRLIFISLMLAGISNANIDHKTSVGVWLFNKGSGDLARDSSGNGNEGTLVNNPKYVAGKFGKALEFDGVDDYVNVNYNIRLILGNNGAISLWFKPSELKPDTHNIISYGGTNYASGFLLNQYGASTFYGYWKTPGPSVTVNPAFFADDWVHLVLTNDNGNLKVYLNGEQEGTGTSGGSITNDYPIYIGATPNGWRVSGIIDDIAIFNVALSEEDIQAIMNQGLEKTLGITAISPSGKLTTTWGDIK